MHERRLSGLAEDGLVAPFCEPGDVPAAPPPPPATRPGGRRAVAARSLGSGTAVVWTILLLITVGGVFYAIHRDGSQLVAKPERVGIACREGPCYGPTHRDCRAYQCLRKRRAMTSVNLLTPDDPIVPIKNTVAGNPNTLAGCGGFWRRWECELASCHRWRSFNQYS